MGGPVKVVEDFVKDTSNTLTKITQPIEKAVTAGVQDTSKNLTTVLQPVEKAVTAVAQDPKALAAIAFAVAAPYAAASLAPYLSGLGAYAGIAADAITSITVQVAQGVPIEKATENALVNVAVSGATGAVQQQIGKVISSPGVTNAITSTVSSGLSTAAKGGSQADVEKAMTAGLAGSTASTIYKEAVDSSGDAISKAIGGATAGAVTGGTPGAVTSGLTSATGALVKELASTPSPTPAPTPAPAPVAQAPVEQVAATPSGVPSAEDFAKLIGAAQPPTASLDTGVVSDAGTGVQVAGAPYLAENAPENIKNLIPAGYRLLSAEESLPQNVKATLLPNGEYAFIGQDTSPEYLATQELPTKTIPATQQVAGVDLTVPEVVTATPETAAVGIGGPAPDVAPEVAVAAPGAAESATVVRVDPSTGNALVMRPSGEVFTVAVDPSTKAGSTISVPSPAPAPSTAPTSSPAPAPTTVPTTAPDFATAPTTTPAPEVAPAPAPTPATDQPILDLIAERPTATDVAAPGEAPATPGKTPITEPPVAAPVTTTEPAPELAPAPVEVDASIPRVEVSGVGNIPAEPAPVPETEPVSIAPPPVSDKDREILNLINPEPVAPEPVTETPLALEKPGAVAPELPAEDVSVEEAGAEPEQPVYDYDPKVKPKPDIFTTTYVSPKTRTAAPTSALGAALGTTGLTSYRGAGEIEGTGSGKPRKNVWNVESLKLKDALGV